MTAPKVQTDQAEPDTHDDYSNDAATFGDRIVAARDAMGLSDEELAHRLGIKKTTLEAWEEDRAEPRANKLQMLAGLLNVSIIWLMSGEGQGLRPPSNGLESGEAAAMVAELRGIRDQQQDLANRVLRLERRILALVQG